MLIMDFISFFIAISGLILAIIIGINQIRHNRILKILQKLPLRRRLFKEWYDLAKNIIDRMVFTEILKREHFMIYKYRIKEEDGTEFIEPAKQRILFRRYLKLREDTLINCGFQKKDKKNKDLADVRQAQMITKTFNSDCMTIPDDILPNNSEEIKIGVLNGIIRIAKENGVKLKYKN